MHYLTTVETAKKWDITANRVTILAKSGRIPGARQIGLRWMIPADAVKPTDARTLAGKTEKQRETDAYRYPSFEYREEDSFQPPLTEEEKILKRATETFYALHLQEADVLLGDLPEKATNKYCRICAMYTGCMLDIFLFHPDRFFDRYCRLQLELEEDFPHKEEMMEYLHELDATLGENRYYADEFSVLPGYHYHESFLPRLANLCAVPLAFADKKLSVPDLKAYEITCIFLDTSCAYVDLQALHLYLGIAYGMLDMEKERDYHIRKALNLAEKYDIWYHIIAQYYYFPRIFKSALADFSEDFKKRLEQLSTDIRHRFARFTDAISLNSAYRLMEHKDYSLIYYAVQGYTNKEVAEQLHISVGAVGKYYGDIYAHLGVENKKQLIDLYYSSMNVPRLKSRP